MNKIADWFKQYETLLKDCNITDVPSELRNVDKRGLQDYFVLKTAVGEVSG